MPDRSSTDHRQARAILEELAAAAQATTSELATALETHPMTIERHCRTLQREGHIRQCTGGVYTLVDSDTDRTTTPTDTTVAHRTPPNPAD